MVYLTSTSNLPRAFLEWGTFLVRRTNGSLSDMSIDPEGNVHMQAGRLYVDMCANRRKVLKTVQLTDGFLDDNEGLGEHLCGTNMIVEDQIGDIWADAWARFAPRPHPPAPEPAPAQAPEPEPVQEPAVEESAAEDPAVDEPAAEAPAPAPVPVAQEPAPEPAEPAPASTASRAADEEPSGTASTFSWWS